MKRYLLALIVLTLLESVAIIANADALTLEWNRSAEADVKNYDVYICKVKGCTATSTGTLWVASVPQTAAGVKPTFVLPATTEGAVAVTATDFVGNQSGASVSLPFSTFVDLPIGPPVPPTGLLLKP